MTKSFSILLLSILILVSGCKKSRDLTKEKPLKNRSAQQLAHKLDEREFKFDWLGMKIATDLNLEGEKESFKANIRVRKDSAIWISISPALGVEMVRILITTDSLKYFSKIPNNKHYYLGDYAAIEDFLGMPAEFDFLQDLFVGNPVDFDSKDDKFSSRIDGQQYVLSSKYKRGMEKLVGVGHKDLDPGVDSIFVDPSDEDYQKFAERKGEGEMLIKRFWLNGKSFKLERTVVNDLFYNRSLMVEHGDFDNEGGQIYPKRTSLIVNDLNKRQQLEYKVTRLKTNKVYDFPFTIPDDYERKYY